MKRWFHSDWRRRFSSRRLYGEASANEGCEAFEVNNWVLSDFVVNELLPVVGTRPFPLNELMLMAASVCRLKPTHIFEWGTHVGKSARVFYETCRHFGVDAEIHSIDLPAGVDHEEHPGNERGRMVRGLPKVSLHTGDGVTVALDLLAGLGGNSSRPLFFIDGDHSYSSVRRELESILQHAPAASLLLHDTFRQSANSGYNNGPYEAMEEVLSADPGRFEVLRQNQGLPGMTLLVNKCRKVAGP